VDTIEIVFADREAALRRYYPSGRLGGMSVAGHSPFAVGTQIRLVVRIEDPRRSFEVPCRVAWSRFTAARNMRPEYGLDFVSADSEARDRLIGFLSESLPLDSVRLDERVKTKLLVRVSGRVPAFQLSDLSLGGLFVAIPGGDLPQVGTQVTRAVRPPLSLRSQRVEGRVAWRRFQSDGRGIGVAFVFHSASDRTRVEALVRKLLKRSRS
jgi:Tfp pilus assembly protein PilZ